MVSPSFRSFNRLLWILKNDICKATNIYGLFCFEILHRAESKRYLPRNRGIHCLVKACESPVNIVNWCKLSIPSTIIGWNPVDMIPYDSNKPSYNLNSHLNPCVTSFFCCTHSAPQKNTWARETSYAVSDVAWWCVRLSDVWTVVQVGFSKGVWIHITMSWPWRQFLTLGDVSFFFRGGGGGGKGKVGCLSTVFEGKFLLSIMCAWIVKTVICCFSKKRPFT